MNLFTVDENLCRKDGFCAAECPLRLIDIKVGSSFPAPVEGAETRCISCGHCVAVCPHGAFRHQSIKPEDCLPVQANVGLSADQAEYFLRARRSIRNYQNRDVDRETLSKVIDTAHYAPTGSNSQMVQWLVLDKQADVKNFSGKIIDAMRDEISAQTSLSERFRMKQMVKAWDAGFDVVSRGAPALIIAHAPKIYGIATVDCTIALTYLDLAASSFGLGACWAGIVMVMVMNHPELQQELALPEANSLFGAMMIGYPKAKYYRLPTRKDAQVIWWNQK